MKNRRGAVQNKNKRDNLKISILGYKLINIRIRLFGQILRNEQNENPKTVLIMRIRHPRRRQKSEWEQKIREFVAQKEDWELISHLAFGSYLLEFWKSH